MPPRIREHSRAKKGTMKRLVKHLFKNHKAALIFSMICIAFNVITNLSSSIFANFTTAVLTASISPVLEGGAANPQFGMNPFTDMIEVSVMGMNLATNLTTLLIVLGSIYFVGIFASWAWNRTMAVVTQKFLNEFRKAMFNHMQDLPIRYFDTHQHGQIMSLYTNDIDTIRQFVSQSLPSLFQTGLMCITLLVTMLLNSVWMTLVVLLGTIAMFLNTKHIGGKSAKYFVKQQMSVAKVEGFIQESINGLKVIKVFNHEDESLKDFDVLNEELRYNSTEANLHGNITGPINGNIGNFVYVLTAVMGLLIFIIPGFNNLTLTYYGSINLSTFMGAVVSFLMMSRSFSNNVNNFSQQVTFIVMGMAGASRCFDLMDEKKEIDEGYVSLVNVRYDENGEMIETSEHTHDFAWKHPHGDGSLTYTPLKGDILLKDVDFSYTGEKLVLKNVNIYAHPGQKIALVGATGAGKTTITNLINRFYDIADGKIRYDGININKIKRADLRRSLGIVLQDTNLFTGTVMENIRYGKLDATDEEVYEAAKIANAYDFISRLPDGFNTVLSGNGSNLSQGQRQLINIARCAIADAPVMILDEATSSIDTRTEKLVQEGMDKLMEGRTVFIIAHRLSTVQNSDAIMVLDHGAIIERGTHAQLIEQKGTYYQLYTGAFELE
ncbi:MAG: ABC transporter ATP-binding protein [Bacilli bacterium]|nr:ABC transporter ATP-binding protein [Bacilli bacterium]